jgi:hypothetical protein
MMPKLRSELIRDDLSVSRNAGSFHECDSGITMRRWLSNPARGCPGC